LPEYPLSSRQEKFSGGAGIIPMPEPGKKACPPEPEGSGDTVFEVHFPGGKLERDG